MSGTTIDGYAGIKNAAYTPPQTQKNSSAQEALTDEGALQNEDALQEEPSALWTPQVPFKWEASSENTALEGLKTYQKDVLAKLRSKSSGTGIPKMMGTLASARSVMEVQKVISDATSNMVQLRMSLASDDENIDKTKVQLEIARMQKVIRSGRRKIRKLNEEDVLERQQKRAQKNEQMEKAREVKAELARRRRARKAKEEEDARNEKPQGSLNKTPSAQEVAEAQQATPYEPAPIMGDAGAVAAEVVGDAVAVDVGGGEVAVDAGAASVDISV